MGEGTTLMSYQFENKVVWITGASSGIGLALAKLLLTQNVNLVVSARSKEILEREFFNDEQVLIAHGDLTNIQTNYDIVESIKSKFGKLDCVILNAGNAEYIDLEHFQHQPFKRMMDTNFLSMVMGIEASLPLLRQSKSPYLVGMSSSVAWLGLPKGQAYSASKAAIRNLFQGLSIELSDKNIDVSWICPGFVKTPLTNKNTFDMPFRIDADSAARIIFKKLEKRQKEIHFPKRFTLLLKLISMLPASWHNYILKGTVPK